MKGLSKAREDWQVIQQVRAAAADLEQLRAHSLQVLDQSCQLLRMIDKFNGPLIDVPRDAAARLDEEGGATAD